MPAYLPSVRAVLSAAALAGIVGCAPPLASGTPVVVASAPAAAATDTVEPPTVQVRYYAGSPTVSVVGWDPAESAYGLRASLRRDGFLIRDHRLFVSTYYVPVLDFNRAVTPSQTLLLTGRSRDVFNCYGYPTCSPALTFGARIPDSLLRTNRDSIAVKFYGRSGRELTITLHRELIDAYLGTVDSVTAALRKRSSQHIP